MSLITNIGRIGDVLFGAAGQLVNSVTQRVTLPIPVLPPAPIGDVLELAGADARRGADLVERAVEALFGGPGRVDADAMRLQRPLLATTTITSSGGHQRLHFAASADASDWGVAGRESGRIAVYVDGRYWSSVIVMSERTGGYAVDLGALASGPHVVELRAPVDVTGPGAPTVRAGLLRPETLTGTAALVARHAPILELRDVDRSARHSTSRSDAPLLVVPAVTENADGTTTIAYRVCFSNEEGGTRNPQLLSRYGRTADLEPVYQVRVRADGSIIESTYQSPVHAWKPFDGQRVGDRPVLRTSSANSMSSARVGAGSERWSDAPIAAVDAKTSDFDVMRAHRWTWTVMAKELLREGKSVAADAVRTTNQVADPRRYVFVNSLTDAQRGAIAARGGLELVLADGRRIVARMVQDFATGPYRQGALELPLGAVADAIVGVGLLGISAAVLDASLQLRELAAAA